MNFYYKSRKAIATFTLVFGAISILAGTFPMISLQAETSEEVQKIAREITVRIDAIYPGSGVIIAKRGSIYYVLTAKHVVKSNEQYTIFTSDGIPHPVKATPIQKFDEVDLAVVTFASEKNYRVATLSRYLEQTYERRSYDQGKIVSVPATNQSQVVFISGFPLPLPSAEPNQTESNRYVFNPGRIIDTSGSLVSNPSVRSEGYRVGYTNLTRIGISGGALLDANGRLIAIHGLADGEKIVGGRVISKGVYEDAATKELRVNFGNSLGIPVKTFLTLLPNYSLQLDLKVENTPPTVIPKSELKSWEPPQEASHADPIFWINAGNQYWRMGDLAKSKESFDRAIEIQPDSWQAWYAKGFVAVINRKFDEALSNCETAIKFNANSYDAWQCKAGALYQLGRLPEALEGLDRAIAINNEYAAKRQAGNRWRENPTDYSDRGEILFALGRTSEAIVAFDKAIELDPEMASPLANRAFVQMMTQDYNGAEASINKALAIDPTYAPAWANKGQLLYKQKLYLESLAAFDTAIKFNDRDPEIWNNRAFTLFYLRKYDSAIESARKALEIDRNYAPANKVIKHIESLQSK